jgi:hypothetical protein
VAMAQGLLYLGDVEAAAIGVMSEAVAQRVGMHTAVDGDRDGRAGSSPGCARRAGLGFRPQVCVRQRQALVAVVVGGAPPPRRAAEGRARRWSPEYQRGSASPRISRAARAAPVGYLRPRASTERAATTRAAATNTSTVATGSPGPAFGTPAATAHGFPWKQAASSFSRAIVSARGQPHSGCGTQAATNANCWYSADLWSEPRSSATRRGLRASRRRRGRGPLTN